ncbi:MAG: hypothetical protein LBQ59_04705 [Candidatus Peribacteria bacterium]|nr:hypothetical protein [Candidatus Peribacteria bacterium]
MEDRSRERSRRQASAVFREMFFALGPKKKLYFSAKQLCKFDSFSDCKGFSRPIAKLKNMLNFILGVKITLRHIEKLFYELPRRFIFQKMIKNDLKNKKL